MPDKRLVIVANGGNMGTIKATVLWYFKLTNCVTLLHQRKIL